MPFLITTSSSSIILSSRNSFSNILLTNTIKTSNADNNIIDISIIVWSRNSFFRIFVSSIVIRGRNSFSYTFVINIIIRTKIIPSIIFFRKIIIINAILVSSIINSIIISRVFGSSCRTNTNIITITNASIFFSTIFSIIAIAITKAGNFFLSIYRNVNFFSFSKPFYGLHVSLPFLILRQMMLFQSSVA